MSINDTDDLMNISQLSDHLNLSAIRITQLIEADLIPSVKVGHELKFSRFAIDQWMSEKK